MSQQIEDLAQRHEQAEAKIRELHREMQVSCGAQLNPHGPWRWEAFGPNTSACRDAAGGCGVPPGSALQGALGLASFLVPVGMGSRQSTALVSRPGKQESPPQGGCMGEGMQGAGSCMGESAHPAAVAGASESRPRSHHTHSAIRSM